MKPFRYERALDVASAIATVSNDPNAQFNAGGTSQVDLMKEGVQRPERLVDISRLPLTMLEITQAGELLIGANVTNVFAAEHPLVLSTYTGISEALHVGASPQIRNIARMAGNLLQRTRCPYMRDPSQACNKRDPESGCAAVSGFNRIHAIFGQVDHGAASAQTCIATHPSDLAVALAAHDARIVVEGRDGRREIPLEDFYRLTAERPDVDTILQQGDLIVTIVLPVFHGRSHYLKVRDRASYAYALLSCAVALEMDGERIRAGRIALGSVAYKPWRVREAERLLDNQISSRKLFNEIAARALDGCRTYPMNGYKPVLGRALIERALLEATGLEPMQGPPGTAFASSVGGIAGLDTSYDVRGAN